MSGKRRITVDEARWNALQQQARQLKELKRNAPRLVADLRRQTQADLSRVSERLENRQRVVEQTMNALSDQTRALETETNRRLNDQAAQMQQQLTETAGNLRKETDAALARQQSAWRAELSAERERQRADLAQLRDEIRDQSQASAETAQAWLHDAALLRDLIRDQLPHERYAPGQLAALARRLTTAQDNARQGQYQSALALAQEAYHDLSELRVEIELRDREWTGLHTVAYEALLELDGLTGENAMQVISAGEAGNATTVDLDVDHWSEGALSALRSDVTALLDQVNDTEEPLTTERLHDVIDVRVPELEQRLGDVVQRAHMRLYASQLRVNVADVVAQALDLAGYQVEDHLYELMDRRRTFFAKLQHPNGNEIVVSVAPSTDESGQCVLRLLSYDYDTASQAELDERTRAVTRQLETRGLHADDQGCEPGEPDRELLDFRRLREAGEAQAAVVTSRPGT
jgi:myosin heavy subunit